MKFSDSHLKAIVPDARINILETGTAATFFPDDSIFTTIEFDDHIVMKLIRERAYIVSKLYFHFYDLRVGHERETHMYFEGGIVSLVKKLNEGKGPIHPAIFITKEVDEVLVEVALQFN